MRFLRTRPRTLPIFAAALIAAASLMVSASAADAASGSNVIAVASSDSPGAVVTKAASVVPSARQLAWQREELTGFVHFGPNTFTGREWGSGAENPDVFNPSNLDTDQWMATFKDAGFKKVILTTKHHDGMLLFPSSYSPHGVANSSWRNGQGDVLKAFTDSAHKNGIKVGFYLSPADGGELPHDWWTQKWVPQVVAKHDSGQALSTIEQSTYDDRDKIPGGLGRYGNGSTPKASRIPSTGDGNGTVFNFTADDYNRYYMNTLYQVLTGYGKVDEVWLDGANPWSNAGLTQKYNFKDWVTMIRTLQPDAAVFQDGGPDVRWVGNEDGVTTRASEWSPIPYNTDFDGNPADPATAANMVLRVPGGNDAEDLGSDAVLGQQTNGSSSWKLLRWAPAECDARLQEPHWFWNSDAQPVPLSRLQQMYLNSVGKNCQLLLNVAPDNTGRFPGAAVSRMKEFGAWIRSLQANVATGESASNDAGTSNTAGNLPRNVLDADDSTAWQPTGTTGNLVVDLGSNKIFNVVDLQEDIQVGQRVSGFAVDAWDGSAWKQVGSATTIGYRRLLKLARPVTTSKVRLRITSSRALPPAIATFALHKDRVTTANLALDKPATQSSTLADFDASRAVDGNTNGDMRSGSVTHTSLGPLDTNPWWQVDLGSSQHVSTIKLWNRTDCCSDRLRQFYVFASDSPFTSNDPQVLKKQAGVWNFYQDAAAGTSLTLPVGRSARYVRVQLVGSDRPLSLAEVEVLG
ncbi:hypothetical protein GCM10029978_063330 [Actinoallomurus acanthiterrae]